MARHKTILNSTLSSVSLTHERMWELGQQMISLREFSTSADILPIFNLHGVKCLGREWWWIGVTFVVFTPTNHRTKEVSVRLALLFSVFPRIKELTRHDILKWRSSWTLGTGESGPRSKIKPEEEKEVIIGSCLPPEMSIGRESLEREGEGRTGGWGNTGYIANNDNFRGRHHLVYFAQNN